MEVKRLASALRLPSSIVEDALAILRKARWEHRPLRLGAAAALLIAARSRKVALTWSEAAEAINASERRLWSAYRRMLEASRVKPRQLTPEMLVYKAVDNVGLKGEEAAKLAREALNLLAGLKRRGCSPRALAAAALYAAAVKQGLEAKATQRSIAKALNVAPYTIRQYYRQMLGGDRRAP